MTLGYYPQHCAGCRCSQAHFWPSITTTITSGIYYVPRHRKPGPAQ